MKYEIVIFGCQFNKSDAERVATVLGKLGYKKASNRNEADLIIVLACSVRQTAIDRIYGLKRKFEEIKKHRPLITILSGCVLDSDKKKMSEFFDLVFPITDLNKLPKLLKEKTLKLPADYLEIHPSYVSEFQAYVPIMTGCNNFCSYCVVPYTRGREVSRSHKEIIKECKELIVNGYKEIILAGQNVNSYKDKNINFPKLLKMIDDIQGEYWLSFATSHPKDMSDDLIKFMGEGKHLIPYLHLPVQSGDDKVLKNMNRHYTVKHYKSLIKKVRKSVPDISISTDIIVGFPGETKNQFNNTVKLFREIKYDMAYIAQYSVRAGTAAAKLEDNVSHQEKKSREKMLTRVLKDTALENNNKLLGKHTEVLVEEYKDGYCYGKTSKFKNIKFKSDNDLVGKIVIIKVIDCYEWGLTGELPKVVVILGTTASGKTKVAVKLARKFKGEIISADSRQVYKGMDIGTGKDLAEYGKIPYHLIDVVDPKDQFSFVDWQLQAQKAIKDILKRNKLPIICGGTGLYISALVEGYVLKDKDLKIKNKNLIKGLDKISLKQLLSRLKKIDLETYNVIDKKNRRRVQRALEIYYETGLPKSKQVKNKKPPFEFLKIGITFPRDVLHKRIDKRLEHRVFKEGMIKEVERLRKRGISWKRLDSFGLEYRFVADYLQKKIDKEKLLAGLSKAIKGFSKRQKTWFKKDKEIIWRNKITEIEKIVNRFIRK